jgi:hydroxymethylglutaryl-CoA lyase
MTLPSTVSITEVGLRDGFQMEAQVLPTTEKARIARALIDAGIRSLQLTSFVSPAAIPQLADAAELTALMKGAGAHLTALVPNRRGALRAIEAGVDELVVFLSASETHNRENVNRSVAESLGGLVEVADVAATAGVKLSGVIATAFGCPFEGDVSPEAVLAITERYASLGVAEISLGDTTGMATPPIVRAVCSALLDRYPGLTLALHFHNTRGLGLVNVLAGLELGVTRFEASIGGLGGCPFAPGATGNVCTEDLVNMLHELGIDTGVDLERLIAAATLTQDVLGRELPGQVMKAGPRLAKAHDLS